MFYKSLRQHRTHAIPISAYPPDWKEKLLFNLLKPRAKGKPIIMLNDLFKSGHRAMVRE